MSQPLLYKLHTIWLCQMIRKKDGRVKPLKPNNLSSILEFQEQNYIGRCIITAWRGYTHMSTKMYIIGFILKCEEIFYSIYRYYSWTLFSILYPNTIHMFLFIILPTIWTKLQYNIITLYYSNPYIYIG